MGTARGNRPCRRRYNRRVVITLAVGEDSYLVQEGIRQVLAAMPDVEVVAINGRRFPGARRDTVMVPAMASVTIAFDADNPGRWASTWS